MQGILRGVIFANFKMEMRPGHSTRAPDGRHDFPARNPLPLAHEIAVIMRINGHDAAGVPDNDHIAIAAQLIAVDNLPRFDGSNGRSFRRGDVETVVEA